ncbi:MAG: IPT/TIG domain-containing protein [Bryobacteraceae bacterium]|jgi:uncharacterized protein (TIGR03437 family)
MHPRTRVTTMPAALPPTCTSCVPGKRATNPVAALLILIGLGPSLAAQQYCVSGLITSVPLCSGCSFQIGNPVAMTFAVQPSSIDCAATSISSNCSANATFSAQIGGLYWSGQNLQLSYSGTVSFSAIAAPGISSYTRVILMGSGTLSPAPSPAPPNLALSGSVSLLSFPGNLLVNGMLPAALPSPEAVAGSNSDASFGISSAGNASFSYTGQNCAAASPALPTVNAGGVVPLYSSANTIQPGSWVSIFGSNLAASATTWNGDFPTSLGGTSVTIDNRPAYLWYVSPGQINLQAPDDSATGSVSVVVTTGAGSVTSSVTLGEFGPSFSLLDGKHVTGIILRSDGSGAYGGGTYDIVGPTGTSLGYKTVAARGGDVLEIFGVGFGPTSPVVDAGKAFSGAAPTTNPVELSINNVAVTPTFAGITSAGLYQINLTLPSGLGSGDVPLQATVGGVQTPSGVVLSVQ